MMMMMMMMMMMACLELAQLRIPQFSYMELSNPSEVSFKENPSDEQLSK